MVRRRRTDRKGAAAQPGTPVAPVAPVVVVVVVVVTTPAGAAPFGSNVATNGVCIVLGKTTGIVPTLIDNAVDPSSTDVGPDARITCTSPDWSVPVQRTEPDATVVASTQHGPDAVSVRLNELFGTAKVADVAVAAVATNFVGRVVLVGVVLLTCTVEDVCPPLLLAVVAVLAVVEWECEPTVVVELAFDEGAECRLPRKASAPTTTTAAAVSSTVDILLGRRFIEWSAICCARDVLGPAAPTEF